MADSKFTALVAEERLLDALAVVHDALETGDSRIERDAIFNSYYVPSNRLKKRIEEYKEFCAKRKRENPGQLMEEIAFLAFQCLKGYDLLRTGQAESAQLDLIVSGSSKIWEMFCTLINLPSTTAKILVEAKNEKSALNDQQFSRLCHLIEHKYPIQCKLGIFFTRKGATGFPRKAKRERYLRDARATQIIFHARTGKFIVVLTHEDIIRLEEIGSLPRILSALISDVEDRLGKPVEFNENWEEQIELPAHLEQYI